MPVVLQKNPPVLAQMHLILYFNKLKATITGPHYSHSWILLNDLSETHSSFQTLQVTASKGDRLRSISRPYPCTAGCSGRCHVISLLSSKHLKATPSESSTSAMRSTESFEFPTVQDVRKRVWFRSTMIIAVLNLGTNKQARPIHILLSTVRRKTVSIFSEPCKHTYSGYPKVGAIPYGVSIDGVTDKLFVSSTKPDCVE